MKILATLATLLIYSAILIVPAHAEEAATQPQVLITNAKIFDGRSEQLTEPMSVLVEGNKIKQIAPSIAAPQAASVIDAGGRVMLPGFIDSHSHLMFQLSFGDAFSSDEF